MSEAEIYPMRHLWSDDDLDFLRGHDQDLVAFFETAAASGGAVIRSFSF